MMMGQFTFKGKRSRRAPRQAVITRIGRKYRTDANRAWELERSSRAGVVKLSYHPTFFVAARRAWRWVRYVTP